MSKPKPTVTFSRDSKGGSESRTSFSRKMLPRLKDTFSLGGYDPDVYAYSFKKTDSKGWKDENALKEELLQIFQREKDSMEEYYLNKIQSLLVGFKEKKSEWEEVVKQEREDLEQHLEDERGMLQDHYTTEINNLKENHEEERREIEKGKKISLEAVEKEAKEEKKMIEDDMRKTHEALKSYMEAEFEAKVKSKIQEQELANQVEIKKLIAKYEDELTALKAKHSIEQDTTNERLARWKDEADQINREEKEKIEKQHRVKTDMLEERLQKEANFRADVERTLNHEKANLQAMNLMLKEELSRIKDEMERLRRLPVPSDINKSASNAEGISYSSRGDLPARLRDEFDRLLLEYKNEVKEKIKTEKELMDEKLEMEKERIRESYTRDKAELERKMADDKYRMERDLDRSRDEIEREVERKLKTKHLQDSLTDQQIKLNETARRLEEEDWKRKHNIDRDGDREKIHSMINEIRKENEGLKIKLNALEDNNKTLKQLKAEGQQEIERLKSAINDLKQMIQSNKYDNDRGQYGAQWLAMEKFGKQDEPKPLHVDPQIEHERRKLYELRKELEKQEREYRDRKTMEDAAKMAEENSKKHFDSLVSDKRNLEDSVKTLEGKISSMQKDMEKLKRAKPQPQPTIIQPQFAPSPVPGSSPVPPALSMDHLDRIDGLLKDKTKLVNAVNDYEDDYRTLERENAGFDKKVKDLEWKVEKLQDKLEKEKKGNNKLETEVESYKLRNQTLKEELEKAKQMLKEEQEKHMKIQEAYRRAGDERDSLTGKLRKSEEIIETLRSETKITAPKREIEESDATRDFVSSLLADSSLTTKPVEHNVRRSSTTVETMVETASLADELERIRVLERDKTELQNRLEDTKNALESYTGKLDHELRNLEFKASDSDKLVRNLSDRNSSLTDAVNSLSNEQKSTAIENWKLLQQKLQLQRLIERLTKIQ